MLRKSVAGMAGAQLPRPDVLVAADSPLLGDVLAGALRRRRIFRVRGSFAPGPAIGAAETDPPDVVVAYGETEPMRALVRRLLEIRVRVVAVGPRELGRQLVAYAASLGVVFGFVSYADELDDLLATVLGVAQGETLCSPHVIAAALGAVTAAAVRASALPAEALTERECQVLRLLEAGRSNKQIAYELRIELQTVKNHVRSIMRKLNVSSRGEAVACLRTVEHDVRQYY